LGIGSSGSSDAEVPLVILRVQILSCHNLEAKHRNGYSDPFVVVSILGKEFRTPVFKRNLNPIYKPEDATFEFPIYVSVHQDVQNFGTLKFDVKDKIGYDFMGEYELPINHWSKGAVFAFDDPNNQPFFVGLVSSRSNTTVHGTMRIKVGFVHPPNSARMPDFEEAYNMLIQFVSGPVFVVSEVDEGDDGLPSHPVASGSWWRPFSWAQKQTTKPLPQEPCRFHGCSALVISDPEARLGGFCGDLHMWKAIHNGLAVQCPRCQRVIPLGRNYCPACLGQ